VIAVCEANAYLLKDGEEQLLLEGVDLVRPHEQGLLLEDIFGRQVIVDAEIKELALVDHRIILAERSRK
jgi:predicted RNA-binding protein